MLDPTNDYLKHYPLLRTNDFDEAREVMSRQWVRHEAELRSSVPFETHVSCAPFGFCRLTYVRCPTPLHIKCAPVGARYVIFLAEEGGAQHTMNGQHVVSDVRHAVVEAPGQEVQLLTHPTRVLVLEFPDSHVQWALTSHDLSPENFHEWASTFDVSSACGATFRSLMRWTARMLDQPESPLLAGPSADQLAQSLLSLFFECLSRIRPRLTTRQARIGKLRLRDLENFIQANLRMPLTVETLAAQAGVSIRTLQISFRRHRGCTPTEFVRLRRLEAIRRQLEMPGPRTSVTQAALEMGFFHLGRFAEMYLRQFGERPSETLARAIRGIVVQASSTRS